LEGVFPSKNLTASQLKAVEEIVHKIIKKDNVIETLKFFDQHVLHGSQQSDC